MSLFNLERDNSYHVIEVVREYAASCAQDPPLRLLHCPDLLFIGSLAKSVKEAIMRCVQVVVLIREDGLHTVVNKVAFQRNVQHRSNPDWSRH